MKKTIKAFQKQLLPKTLSVLGIIMVAFTFFAVPNTVSAQSNPPQPEKNENIVECPPGQYGTPDEPCVTSDHGQIKIGNPDSKTCANGDDCGGIVGTYVNPFIGLMTAIVGIVIAISLVAAGITYASAGGDSSKVAAAKKRITNTIIALIAYIFTFGLLQWLVPGGLI